LGLERVKVNAVVLAGGTNGPEMAAATGVTNRALTPLGARTMLDYVTSALHHAESVGDVFVVGDVPAGPHYEQIPGGASLLDNLLAGVRAAQTANTRILVSTSDIPFLMPEAVEDFIRQAHSPGAVSADLCCSYVPLARCRERFPEMKRTAIKLREGRFTLGNLMLVNPQFLEAHRDIITRAYDARKSAVGVARLLGAGLPARLLLAQCVSPSLLTVPALEEGVSRLIGGGRVAAIRSEYPEVGTDVDKPDDVAVARRMLAGGPPALA